MPLSPSLTASLPSAAGAARSLAMHIAPEIAAAVIRRTTPVHGIRCGVVALSIAVIAMSGLFGGAQALGQTYAWNTTSGGNWNTGSNWDKTGTTDPFPNGFNDTAVVSRDISGTTTINLNTAIMLNRLTVGDSNNVAPSGYVIAPNGGSLTFRNAQSIQSRPFITSTNGPNAITAPITVDNAVLTISNTGGGSLSLSSIDRVRGGGYRFNDANTTVSSGLTATNGIGNVFATFGTSGTSTDWVTYNPTTGAVGQFTSYGTLASSNATTNVSHTGPATLSADTTMNSFRWVSSTGNALTLNSNDMTIQSGGFLRSGGNHNITVGSTTTSGKVKTPDGVPLTVWNFSNNPITFNAPLAVDGLNNMGTGRIVLANAGSTFGAGEINVLQNSITFTYASPSLSNNVNIANGGQLIFNPTSSSTMTLSGTVMVNGLLSGNANGSYAIGTLKGFGSGTTTPVTVLNALAPGDEGTGTLDFGNNLTLSGSSTYRVELGGTTPGDGKGFYDQVNMTLSTGSITLNEGAGLNLSLVDGFTPSATDMFFILTRADSAAWTTTFAGLAEGAPVTLGSFNGSITYLANWTGSQATSTATGGNDVAIVSVVPEPGTITLLGLGGLTLAGMGWRRRSRRSA